MAHELQPLSNHRLPVLLCGFLKNSSLKAPSALMQPHLGMLEEKRIRDSFRPEVLKPRLITSICGPGGLLETERLGLHPDRLTQKLCGAGGTQQ